MPKEKTNLKMQAISEAKNNKENNKLKEDEVTKQEFTVEQKKERRIFILKGIGIIFLIGWVVLLASAIEVLVS